MTDIFGKGHPDEPKAIYPGDCTKGEIGYCNAGRWAGWIFWRHPDGQWVSLAKIPDDKSADRPAAVSRADAIAARKSIENMTRSFTDMKPWQEICKRLLDDVIGDDPVMVDEVNPPAAVDVEDIRNGLRIVIDSVKPDPTNWHKVDMILEDLIRHGHLTPAPIPAGLARLNYQHDLNMIEASLDPTKTETCAVERIARIRLLIEHLKGEANDKT